MGESINNNPPPWSEAPPWAMWRAQDEDGTWVWYENEPVIATAWPQWTFKNGRHKEYICTIKNSNWLDTLQKRPENE